MHATSRRNFIIGLLVSTALTKVTLLPSAVTLIGAVYATKSRLLQRVFIPSFSNAEITEVDVLPGETLIRLSLADYIPRGAAFAQAMIGEPTFSGRCVVVDANNVVIDAIMADPDVYWDQRGRVIPSDDLGPGDVWIDLGDEA